MKRVYTIGHSNHPIERFLDLLQLHNVTAVADVRSSPYSRLNPQFNREPLARTLRETEIEYVFLGAELGARSDDPGCYVNGKVVYGRLAATAGFRSGIDRVIKGAQNHTIALMCSEKEPLDCHRTILVSRELVARGVTVGHIHADGSLESHPDAVMRLRSVLELAESDLFQTDAELEEIAYARQEARIAYVAPEPDGEVNQ